MNGGCDELVGHGVLSNGLTAERKACFRIAMYGLLSKASV